jgi:hypothetical protein
MEDDAKRMAMSRVQFTDPMPHIDAIRAARALWIREVAKVIDVTRVRRIPLTRAYAARYFLLIAAPTVYFGSTKLPSLTFPHWLSIM